MAATAVGRGLRYTIWEPLQTAWELLPQAAITTASVYMVAQFGAAHHILPPVVAYVMAAGFEWTWLRGIATASKVKRDGDGEQWINLLTKTALVTVIAYGLLYIIGLPVFGVIPAKPGPVWGVLLAVAKVVPIALMGYAAANLHRIQKQEEQAAHDAKAERQQREEESRINAEQARLAMLQTERDAIEVERQRRQMELEMYRQATIVKRELRASATPPARKKPVTIDGVTYESRAAAAQALGISPQAVSKRAKK